MTLAELKPGTTAIVQEIQLSRHGKALSSRLQALGITPNRSIKILRKAILGGPLHIRIGTTTEIAIRRQEAEMILVKP
jgi:ferrous iron transport protein A